jgi:predicted dinucleotide-binding enzyme
MSSISVIGSGNMASAIGALAVEGGNAVEVLGRDTAKAAALASTLGNGATAGTWGAAPAGDIVILAVLFDSAVPVVSQHGDALAGKIIVDITNPFNASATGLAIPDDTSIAQMVAEAAPAAPMSSRRSTPSSATSWPRAVRWMCSWPATTRRPRRACQRSSRASDCARGTPAT